MLLHPLANMALNMFQGFITAHRDGQVLPIAALDTELLVELEASALRDGNLHLVTIIQDELRERGELN